MRTGVSISRYSIVLLLFIAANVFATKATIDADDSGANYRSLDSAVLAFETSKIYPDTFLFTGSNQHVYTFSRNVDNLKSDSLVFISATSNPDSFAVIKNTATSSRYNLFSGNKLQFEKVVLTGTNEYTNANTNKNTTFKQCIIRDWDTSFIEIQGDQTATILFENCLFANNDSTAGIFRITLWANGTKLTIINCTFDGKGRIFNIQGTTVKDTAFVFKNNIFNYGNTVFPTASLKARTSNSLTSDTSLTGYGASCKKGDPGFITLTGRTKPADWKISSASLAAAMGTATGAPTVDIAGQTRGTSVDAGCWLSSAVQLAITKHPDSIRVGEGRTVKFYVVATGTNKTYSWFKSGNTTDTLSHTDTLTRTADTLLSGALYYCVVSSGSSFVQSRMGLLTVVKKPRIIQDLSDTTVQTDAPLLFRIKANGTGFSYRWFRNGAIVTGQSTDSLPIAKTDTSYNNDSIQCIIATDFDTVKSRKAVISVASTIKPKITKQQTSPVSIKLGGILSLTVEASGVPTPTFTWYKNGKDSVGNKSTFTDSSVAWSDSGTYRCFVRNSAGYDSSNIVTVKVVDSTEIINSIKLSGIFIDSTKVKMTISGFKNFPRKQAGVTSYVDTIGVWYNVNSFPALPDLQSESKIFIPFSAFPSGDSLDTLLNVKSGGTTCYSYYFVASPFLKNSSSSLLLPFDTSKGSKVKMCKDSVPNPLSLSCTTFTRSDTVHLTISGLSSVDRTKCDYILITYGNTTVSFVQDSISISSLSAGIGQYVKTYRNAIFVGDTTTISFTVKVRDVQGNTSDGKSISVPIGIKRPVNTATLTVDSVSNSKISLSWQIQNTETIDSIRVWYGKEAVPLIYNPDTLKFSSKLMAGDVRNVSLTKLTAGTTYHFGLQIKQNDLWSAVTEKSSGSAMTPIDTTQIADSVIIKNTAFDDKRNLMKISWIVDTTGIGAASLQVGIQWSLATFPEAFTSGANTRIIPMDSIVFNDKNITNIYLGKDQLFDTTYYFSMFMRRDGGAWSSVADSAQATLKVLKPQWQEVSYFENGDSVFLLNKSFVIRKSKLTPSGAQLYKDTIEYTQIPNFSDTQLIMLSPTFHFRYCSNTLPMEIGFKYDSIPAGYTWNDLYLYEYFDGKFHILDRVAVDTISKMVFTQFANDQYGRSEEHRKSPHVIMVDESKPVVTVSNTESPLTVMHDFITRIQINDNVVNGSYYVKCAMLDKKLQTVDSGKTNATNYIKSIATTYTDAGLTDLNSLRMILIVSNGSYRDTIDISRQVVRSADAITSKELRWIPISTTTELEIPAVESALIGLCQDNTWSYDSIQFRLFYWDPTSAYNDQRAYVQYSPEKKDLFNLIPGKVLWLKSRTQKVLQFGNGKTVDIRTPFSITIPSGQWVDFSLPYNINLFLEDIFAKSPSISKELRDSVLLYQFDASNATGRLECSPVYFPELSDYRSTMITLKNSAFNSYSFFNKSSKNIKLVIPPIDTINSGSHQVVQKKAESSEWYVSVNAQTDDEVVAPVFCGYRPGSSCVSKCATPPSPGTVKVSVCDSNSQNKYGSLIYHQSKSGFAYPIVISNNSGSITKTVSYSVNTSGLSNHSELVAVIYNAGNGQTQNVSENQVMTLAPGENAYRWVLVGDTSYVASWASGFKNYSFNLQRIISPHGRSILFNYTIPYEGIRNIRIRMINQQGQIVWSKSLNNVKPGNNLIAFDNNTKILAPGCYVIQLTGYDAKMHQAKSLKSKFMYIPQ